MRHLSYLVAFFLGLYLLPQNALAFIQVVNVSGNSAGATVFSPAYFTILPNDTVRWQWINGSHTTTSDTIPSTALPWNQALNASSPQFSYIPSVLGTYKYYSATFPGTLASFTVVNTAPLPPAIDAIGPINICQGQYLQLTASSLNASSYQWKKNGTDIPGATLPNYTPTTSGVYTVTATNAAGTSSTSLSVQVNVNPYPTISASHTAPSICPGKCDTISLTSNVPGTGYTFSLQNQSGGGTISGNQFSFCAAPPPNSPTGVQNISITGTANNCASTIVESVEVLNAPLQPTFIHNNTGSTYSFYATNVPDCTLIWNFGDGSLPFTGSSTTHTYSSGGNFAVTLTAINAGGCSTSTVSNFQVPLSIRETEEGTFSIYPNPAAGTVAIKSKAAFVSISILDITGHCLKTIKVAKGTTSTNISLSDVADGMYFLSIYTDDANSYKKLEVRH